MQKGLFSAVWTFVGTTVGAGILGLPFVFYKAVFLTGLFLMLFISIFICLVNLYLGEIILRTKGKHQLTGLAEKYLGSKFKYAMFFVNLLSITGALAAYTIASGDALSSIFGGNAKFYSLIFFIIMSFIIFFSIKIIDKFESIFTPLKLLAVIFISLFLFNFVKLENLMEFSLLKILIPYGAIVFAFTGISAIPSMNEELKNKKLLFTSIVIGIILTFITYLLFIFAILGAKGIPSEVATASLSYLGFHINWIANLFALFALATAFVSLGFALKENFTLDLKIRNFTSWIIVVVLSFILAFSGLSFITILELSGAIAIGLIFLFILLMHSNAVKLGDRKPEYVMPNSFLIKFILFSIIFIGIFYTIIETI
jgi:amino acid permease